MNVKTENKDSLYGNMIDADYTLPFFCFSVIQVKIYPRVVYNTINSKRVIE